MLPRDSTAEAQTRRGGPIGLEHSVVLRVAPRRYRITYDWLAHSPGACGECFAVTRPIGIEMGRLVHLPTYALLTPDEWPEDTLVRETMEFVVPDDAPAGRYRLVVSWHDGTSMYAADTGDCSIVGGQVEVGSIVVE